MDFIIIPPIHEKKGKDDGDEKEEHHHTPTQRRRKEEQSLNVKAAYLETLSDTIGAAGVLAAGTNNVNY